MMGRTMRRCRKALMVAVVAVSGVTCQLGGCSLGQTGGTSPVGGFGTGFSFTGQPCMVIPHPFGGYWSPNCP